MIIPTGGKQIMGIKYLGLGHVAIRCKNYEKMRDFYVNTLGFKELFHLNQEDGRLWLSFLKVAKGQFIELFPGGYNGDNHTDDRSHHHFCFEINNYAETIRLLESRGVHVHSGPVSICPRMEEPYEAYDAGMCGSRCAFIVDPEGNDIELMQFTPRSMQIKYAD
jgi:lactoylglutathione lyase